MTDRDYFQNVWDKDSKWAALKTLEDVIDVLEQAGCYPFLFYGSLLGAVRHGGIIPWDGDIDLCSRINVDMTPVLSQIESLGYTVYPQQRSPNFFRVLVPHGKPTEVDFTWPWIDVDYYRIDNKELSVLNVDGSVFYKCPADEVIPLQLHDFEDRFHSVPKNPELHLDRLYPDWRTVAHSSVIDHRRSQFFDKRVKLPLSEVL